MRIRLSPSGPFTGSTLDASDIVAQAPGPLVPPAFPLFGSLALSSAGSFGKGTTFLLSAVIDWNGVAADQARYRLVLLDSLGAVISQFDDYTTAPVIAAMAGLSQQAILIGRGVLPASVANVKLAIQGSSVVGAPSVASSRVTVMIF